MPLRQRLKGDDAGHPRHHPDRVFWAFGYALVPEVIYGLRERVGAMTIQTSVVTGSALFAVAGVYFSLRLWFAATARAVTGTLWMVLLGQRLAYGPVRRDRREDARRS